MIDVNGEYKKCVEEANIFTGKEYYRTEAIRLINLGGEKNLLKAKKFINLLLQLEL